MKSQRPALSAAASLALAAALMLPACKKQAPASEAPAPESAAQPTPAPGESGAAAAGETAAAAGANAGADQAAAATGADQAAAARGDVVAVGSDGKAVAAATAGKTIADTESYIVSLASPAKVVKGAQTIMTIEVKPKTGWHLNQDYPTRLTVNPPAGVSVSKDHQGKGDAVAFAEDHGAWKVSFTAASPGDEAFKGVLKFAVCTATSCDPKKQDLGWTVKVE